jgi:DNA-binding NarL/FixJ family response regulator
VFSLHKWGVSAQTKGWGSLAWGIARAGGQQHPVSAAVWLPRPEVATPALRLLEPSVTNQAMSRDPVRTEDAHPSRAVVVAGGQALVRATRCSVLSRGGLNVAANVADTGRAAKAAELYGAGLVLLDSEIPGGCLVAVRRILERAPGSAVLVVAAELEPERLLAAVRAGALGFIAETHGAGGLIRAVEVALAGESVIPRAGVVALIDELRGGAQEQTSVEGLPLQLTRREADVMKRRRDGMTTKEIAHELDLSDVTVRRHLSSVRRKARQARPLTLALGSTS